MYKTYFTFILFIFSFCAKADHLCPEYIDGVNQYLSKKYGDYDDFSENLKYGLLNVSIAEGDKPVIKTLIPDDEINKKEGEYKIDASVWVVEGANKNETWIKCEYRNTSIVLVKKIPDGVKKCSVTTRYDANYNNKILVESRCY